MQNVKPCPYCGGEIEMVKLIRNKNDKHDVYRIECRKCRKLVARGEWFPIETPGEGLERIRDYKKYIENKLAPSGWGHKQTHGEPKYDG